MSMYLFVCIHIKDVAHSLIERSFQAGDTQHKPDVDTWMLKSRCLLGFRPHKGYQKCQRSRFFLVVSFLHEMASA